jgi:hypothetical protein
VIYPGSSSLCFHKFHLVPPLYLTVSYEAKKMRETRKRELAKAGYSTGSHGSPVKPGTAGSANGGEGKAAGGDGEESVISMSDDRAAEAAALWAKAREEQTAHLHQETQAFNTVANSRREREGALAKLELELDHLAGMGVVDFSDLEERVDKLKVDYTAQLEQSEVGLYKLHCTPDLTCQTCI